MCPLKLSNLYVGTIDVSQDIITYVQETLKMFRVLCDCPKIIKTKTDKPKKKLINKKKNAIASGTSDFNYDNWQIFRR